MDRKPCGDWALAFGVALKTFAAKGVFGSAKALKFQLFFASTHLNSVTYGNLQNHRSLCKRSIRNLKNGNGFRLRWRRIFLSCGDCPSLRALGVPAFRAGTGAYFGKFGFFGLGIGFRLRPAADILIIRRFPSLKALGVTAFRALTSA